MVYLGWQIERLADIRPFDLAPFRLRHRCILVLPTIALLGLIPTQRQPYLRWLVSSLVFYSLGFGTDPFGMIEIVMALEGRLSSNELSAPSDRKWPIAPVGIRPFRGIGDWLL